MKTLLLTLYSIVVSIVVLALLYYVNPLVIEYPKKSLAILLLLMLTSFGTGARSMIEIAIMYPLIKIANGQTIVSLSCSIVFAIGLLISLVIPWLNGISGFNIWNWLTSIGFTLFAFETFYAFIGASVSIDNTDREFE